MDISDSQAKGRSFYKIVLSEISLHDKLMIPGKFARKYRKYLNVRVCLKASKGEIWPVDLVGYGGELWLQNGWPEFASCYSLRFGHFLVFQYQGNSHFDVFIYDKSGIEIDYPFVSTVADRDEQDSFNEAPSTRVGKRRMSDIHELRACKKTRANSACIEPCHIGDCWMRKLQPQKIAKLELNLYTMHQDRVTEGASAKDEQNSTALSKVSESSKRSFVLTVPSYLGGLDRRVVINKAFAGRYMRSTRNFEVWLEVEERIWGVRCTVSGNRHRFCKGWSKFASENSLCAGDVCVFELINEAQMLLKVFIHRAAKS